MDRLVLRWIGMCAVGLSAVGCSTTVNLKSGPSLSSLSTKPGAAKIIVAQPAALRTDKQTLGTIGRRTVVLKDNPSEFVAKEFVAALNERGVDASEAAISSESPADIAATAQRSNADGVLTLAVQSISVESAPPKNLPTARAVVQAQLHNRQGEITQTMSAGGHVQRRINIGLFSASKSISQLTEEAGREAVQRITQSRQFAEAMDNLTQKQETAEVQPSAEPSTP